MQDLMMDIVLVLVGYLLGSIPFGLILVKLKTGKDIRSVESGRTGGANAMRAGGLSIGLMTAIADILKGALAVWIAQAFAPTNDWAHILAPIGAVLGHNYSLYLPEFDENHRFLRFRGGAGAAPALGGAIGLWWPSLFIILPLGALAFFVLGYASLTTISVGISTLLIFAVRAYLGMPGANWLQAFYGVVVLALLVWALKPNIQKLMNGTERVIGMSLHGKMKAKQEQQKIAEGTNDTQ
jgi:acyl phosphate:glycerol-3-phosphate acyltransferase